METFELPQIWERLTDKLSHATSESNMDMYIRQITPLQLENDIIYCSVPSTTLCSAIQQNFLPLISAALKEITNNNNIQVELNIKNHNSLDVPKETYKTKSLFSEDEKSKDTSFESNINKKQRFETFVVGNSNRFATAAAQAVAKDPGNVYNPLFIYGNSGLGKTHLMHAIGNAILEVNPGAKVKYVTSETFTNEIINAIQNHTVKDFQEKYRTIDCLIIDDIQFLENKERTQEEFFHTFNALKEANKQIVISSDRHPQSMDKLEERLRSRFVNGEVIQTVAISIDNNIRMIEGAFNRIVAYADLMHMPIDMKVTAKILEDFGSHTRQNITIENITNHICNFFNLQKEDLIGKKRPKNIAMPRQIAMYLCRTLTDSSLPKIGQYFGGRDHTTVIHACEKIDKLRKEDKSFDNQIQQFEEKIRSL